MRIRKPKNQKFYVDATHYVELRSIPKSVHNRAVSLASNQVYEQPTTAEGYKKLQEKESIQVQQTIDSGAVYAEELRYSLVGFLLPDDSGSVSSDGMTKEQMMEFIDYADDDLDMAISQAVDIMSGNDPDEKDWARLAKIGITPQMMGYSDAEVKFPVKNPLEDGVIV